jgi:hypothetical protein
MSPDLAHKRQGRRTRRGMAHARPSPGRTLHLNLSDEPFHPDTRALLDYGRAIPRVPSTTSALIAT